MKRDSLTHRRRQQGARVTETMRRIQFILVVLFAGLFATSAFAQEGSRTPAPQTGEGFSAIVTPGEAKFTLPAPARKRFEWHLETTAPNQQEYRMHVVVENVGQHYTFGFYVWKSRVSKPGSGDLSDLLKAGQKTIFERTQSGMRMIARVPVITVTQKDASIVITIRGKEEIARLFSGHPAEVVFEIKLPGDSLISQTVAVTYKN